MAAIIEAYNRLHHQLFGIARYFDGAAPLLIRVILIPVLWMAGTHKIDFETLMPYQNTVDWFGNPDWGLGLPLPTLMAFLAGWTELLGAVLLALGLGVRWIAVPLMITMLVAALTAHWDNGWQSIADSSAPFANQRVLESAERLDRARQILQQHGNYDWLTGRGSIVILNNGIEFAAIYFVMLLSLFFSGGGRFVSLDDWLRRWLQRRASEQAG